MTGRPFAVFDIDGTLLRWQLYHAVADELVKSGQIDKAEFNKVLAARMTWKKREQSNSYIEYENQLVDYFDRSLINVSVENLREASQAVIEKYKDQVYSYTRDLIKELKTKNYLLFAISASENEIVNNLANYYEFDDAAGSIYGIEKGRFTGQNIITNFTQKPVVLKKMIEKHSATIQDSIGVGDSESDIEMLKFVQRPIAFNPTKTLYETAKNNQWEIVVERKNVIYQLGPSNGKYELR